MHTQVEIHTCTNMHMHIYKCPFQPPLFIYCADFHALGFHNPMKILLFHVALNAMQCLSSKYVQVYTLFSIFSQDCDNKCEYAFTGSRRHSSHVMMLLGIVNRLSIPHAGEFRQCFPQKGLSWDQIVPPGLLWDREPPPALLWGCQPSLPAWASSKLTAAAGGRF